MSTPEETRTDYYVYEHWRPDKSACFYVGKGKYQKRAFDMGPAAQAKAVTCLDDGVTHQSANAAAKYYGLKNGNSITAVCLGKPSRLRAAGRRFNYAEAA